MERILKRSALRALCTSAVSYQQERKNNIRVRRARPVDKKARAGLFTSADESYI